jgi:hypothetical protein
MKNFYVESPNVILPPLSRFSCQQEVLNTLIVCVTKLLINPIIRNITRHFVTQNAYM